MLRKLDEIICRIQELFLAACVITMSVILIGNFIARAVFHSSWSFSEEVGKFVIIFVTFVGTTIAARYGEHITMTAFIDRLKPNVKLKVIALTNLLTAALFGLLCFYAVNYVSYTKMISFTSPALRFPMYIIYLSLPISFFLSAVEYLKHFYANLKGKYLFENLNKKEDEEAC